MMLDNKMAEERIPINGFVQNPDVGSNPPPVKKKRNLPGTPDPEAEVIALSPKTLMATNRFLCEICGKGFQRDQNLQLHRRGHNLPWKLKQRTTKEVRKRVYVCPEKSCVHHHPSRALGDLTGIKKHFCRKHGEKKWKCEKCSKRYAVQSDWKAHSKTCGTREYKCDCGTIFSRRDSFITHRAFCDALAEETARVTAASNMNINLVATAATTSMNYHPHHLMGTPLMPPMHMSQHFSSMFKPITSDGGDQSIDQARRGLSLWMGQGMISQGHESIIPLNNNNNNNNNSFQEIHHHQHHQQQLFGNESIVSCSNPQPSDYNLSWVFGSKIPTTNSETLASTSLPLSEVKESPGTQAQLVSVPSLYSSQHQTHPSQSPNMSATALLQKAAQIGATSTDQPFLGSSSNVFGLKCNNNNNNNNSDNNNSNQVVHDQDGGSKFCSLYGSLESDDMENSASDITTLNQFQMYVPPVKRRRVHDGNEDGNNNGGQTRDFLGVGVQAVNCRPSSINGWI